MLDPIVFQEVSEFFGDIFATLVSFNSFDCFIKLCLYIFNKFDDGRCRLGFLFQEIYLGESGFVINNREEVTVALKVDEGERTADVAVDEVEALVGSRVQGPGYAVF